jgi:hypothetical protein
MDYLGNIDEDISNAFDELGAKQDLPCRPRQARQAARRRSRVPATYLLLLSGPLTPRTIAAAAKLSSLPLIRTDESGTGTVKFAQVNETDLAPIENWLTAEFPIYRQGKYLKFPLHMAHKDPLPPTLGIDPTLPQHRPDTAPTAPPPPQQYPVWYFFYGTLTDPGRLRKVLELRRDPRLVPAILLDGAIRRFGGYRALVDSPGSSDVVGWAHLLGCAEDEVELRLYESVYYEVVKCRMVLGGEGDASREVMGLAFRFAWDEGELS